MAAARVLVLDDDEALCELLASELEECGYQPVCVGTAAAAFDHLDAGQFDVLVMDIRMPGRSGIHLCTEIAGAWPELPVILMSAFGNADTAIQAMRAGAYDFLIKPFETEELDMVLRRAVERNALQREVKRLQRAANARPGFTALLGASPVMEALYDRIERVAMSQASVLIYGESGSGKELIARAIHELSRRRAGPFVALNCAAVPDTLLESELFGHERGAFTDAKSARPGLLRQAHGGTLFLDEIGDMSIALQPKLLRALEERTVRPVGGDREVIFDTRIVAATHRDLNAEVGRGSFRADLFFRLNVVSIEVPPLRSRGDDLLFLANHFLGEFATRDDKPVHGLSEEAAQRLAQYRWPGNVRELRNCMEHAVAMARTSLVSGDDLPEYVRAMRPDPGAPARSPGRQDPAPNESQAGDSALLSLFEVERRHVLRVLESVGGNKTMAAKILGIDRKTLHSRLTRYEQDAIPAFEEAGDAEAQSH
ncbi:MAG: sigma-54 dependent transcriptional regulator [Myxococcales bacterium]